MLVFARSPIFFTMLLLLMNVLGQSGWIFCGLSLIPHRHLAENIEGFQEQIKSYKRCKNVTNPRSNSHYLITISEMSKPKMFVKACTAYMRDLLS